MTVARSIVRSVASPVARAVVSGIGGRSYADVVLSIPDLLGYWKFESDSWTPGNTAPVEIPNLVVGSTNTLHLDCLDNTAGPARTREPTIVQGPFGPGSYGFRPDGDQRYNNGIGGYCDYTGDFPGANDSFTWGLLYKEDDYKARAWAFGQAGNLVWVGENNNAGPRGSATRNNYGGGGPLPSGVIRATSGSGTTVYSRFQNNELGQGQWRLICLRHDTVNDRFAAFINGVKVDDTDISALGFLNGEFTIQDIGLARYSSDGRYARPRLCTLADFWVTPTALSDAQIAALWQSTGLPELTPGRFTFDGLPDDTNFRGPSIVHGSAGSYPASAITGLEFDLVTTDTQMIVFGDYTISRYLMAIQQGNPVGAHLDVGTPTIDIDGVDASSYTRDQLYTALADGSSHHVTITGLTMTNWVHLYICGYNNGTWNGNLEITNLEITTV